MTTLFLRLGALRPKNTFLLFGMLLLGNGVFAQLDSVSVSSVTFSQEIVTDSITSITDTLDVMNIDVYIDDIDFMGEVIITVYETSTNFPVGKVKLMKLEAIETGVISGSNITVSLYLDSTESYTGEILVRNFQGANTPLVVFNHN